MHAQRAQKSAYRPRNTFQRAPIRARLGLAMRRSMDFGEMGDIESMLRAEGLALAPISTGDASLTVNGLTVLPTAEAGDIDNGALKGLVVPGGMADVEGDKAARALIDAARAKGAPIIAMGTAVPEAVDAAGGDPAQFQGAAGVLVDGDVVTLLADRDALSAAAARIG